MRNARRPPVGVALFPFLAVLICTMGALIVLLVLLVQQARVDAQTITRSQIVATADNSVKERLEDERWRAQLLQQSRSEKAKELGESRDKLAHLEDHIQQLEKQAGALLERVKAIDEGKQLRQDGFAAAQNELARVKAELDRKRAELEAAKKQSQGDQWYALIPYDGPHGTRRRPIYLECTELGVVIQPEGILLGEADFNGPRGPGNPLDAAVRAIREHLQRSAGARPGEAYPLLVVRPGGTEAYLAAREALSAWDDEFGYELVGDDKRLDFGPPDATLVQTLQGSLLAARQRQAVMAAMMPRRFQSQEPTPAANPERSNPVGAPGSSAPGRGLGGAGNGGAGYGGVGNGGGGSGTGLAGGTGSHLGDPQGTGPFSPGGTGIGGPGGASRISGTGSGGGFAPGNFAANVPGGSASPQQGFAGGSGGTGQPGGVAQGGQIGAGGSGPQMGGTSAAGSSAGGSSAGGTTAGGAGGAAGSATTGQVPSPSLQFGQPPPRAGGQASGTARSGSTTNSGAAGRGNNWGLPGSRGRTTAVTRPLHVAVLRDRLVLVPDQGDRRPPQHLPIAPALTPADVDRFVAAVQSEIKGWGLAVADGYWKPILQFEVAPDAEAQFVQLQTALSGSGFAIERKSP